ncbi:MAG: LL-diaminopimelate aminotransferase [Methermicoccaceae archaeon]
MVRCSYRLDMLPVYLFAEIDEAVADAKRRGVDIIDLGVGDPDMPTPAHIVEEAARALHEPAHHRYPSYAGMAEFRRAAARWYERRFGVVCDPESEVIALIGSKEGIAHMPLAFLDAGDVALVPDPAYPVYANATILAGGVPYAIPLLEENGFLPELDAIPLEVSKKAKMLFLNYPNNPTAATADRQFFREVVEYANEWDVLVCHDNPYSELAFDGYAPPSFLEVKGAKEVGIEFNSLSKTYCMTGWRIGFALGGAHAISALGKVKTNVDSGAFEAVQVAAIRALTGPQQCVRDMLEVYAARRRALLELVDTLGLEAAAPRATFYVWARLERGVGSVEYARRLLDEAGLVITPGVGFGEHGEGYVRLAMTQPTPRIEEAIRRAERM